MIPVTRKVPLTACRNLRKPACARASGDPNRYIATANYFLYLLSIFDRRDANIHRRTGGLISKQKSFPAVITGHMYLLYLFSPKMSSRICGLQPKRMNPAVNRAHRISKKYLPQAAEKSSDTRNPHDGWAQSLAVIWSCGRTPQGESSKRSRTLRTTHFRLTTQMAVYRQPDISRGYQPP